MFDSEKNTTTVQQPEIQAKQQPFFSKEGEGSFFSKTNKANTSFFSPSNSPFEGGMGGVIQPKLTIGQPNDKYEVEADAMADTVVQRLSNSSEVNNSPLEGGSGGVIQRKCSSCEEEENLQKKENGIEKIDRVVQRKSIFESNVDRPDADVQTKLSTTSMIQAKCACCEQEETLQKKEESLVDTAIELQRKELIGPDEIEEYPDLQPKPIFESTSEFPEGEVQTKLSATGTGIHTKCAACEEEKKIHTKSDSPVSSGISDIETQLDANKGGGSPLTHSLNESMGGAFGSDFSGVRIHTDSSAVQMNKEMNAQAFTHGNDIYFNEGKYNASSTEGKHLLAHELTHTIQQGASKQGDATNFNKSSKDSISKSGENKVMRSYLRDSTMEICLQSLESQTFRSTTGSVKVKIRPRLSDPNSPDCKHHKFYVYLMPRMGVLGFLSFGNDPLIFDSSKPSWKGWTHVPTGNYYLIIRRDYDNPNCCLLGDIVVTDTNLVDCEEIRHNREFPSQLGGSWDWNSTGNDGSYGPGPKLYGSNNLNVYMRDPQIPSGAKCRGACGPDCDTCKGYPNFTYTDPETGVTWLYENFEVCNAHEGCRQHDAGFDWAAAEKGERGRRAPGMKWHMSANYECICNYNLAQCYGWIKGKPPHTEKLYFADKAEQISSGFAQTEDSQGLPPEPIIDPGDDELRERCLRGEVDRSECDLPFTEEELRIINSMGHHRNIDIDPDQTGEPEGIYLGSRRIDDAPALLQFRISYNFLDRWRLYINQNEQDLYDFFEISFINRGLYLPDLLDEIKVKTKSYKVKFRNLSNSDEQALVKEFQSYMIGKKEEVDRRNARAAQWYQKELAKQDTFLTIDEINHQVNVGGFLIWREKWLGASLAVNRILNAAWPPAKHRIKNWVREYFPTGNPDTIEDLNYLGSLAKGYKGPPKQYIEFYSRDFDVDADLRAPVLVDYGVSEGSNLNLEIDRGSLQSKVLKLEVIDNFRKEVHEDMTENVFGYDENEEFEIFIYAEHTDQHKKNVRLEKAKCEIFLMRRKLLLENYEILLADLYAEGLLIFNIEEGLVVDKKVEEQEHYARFMQIINQHETNRIMRIIGRARRVLDVFIP